MNVILGVDTQNFIFVGAAFIGAVIVLLIIRGMRRGAKGTDDRGENLTIDLTTLDVSGPSDHGPQLEFYGTPVRLLVLVIAPAGRGQLPPKEELRETVDYLLPGLAKVLDTHRPIFRSWESQLSTQGFANSFFNNLALPGDRGKGTPLCSVVGKFDIDGGQLLAGLVCRAEKPNGLSQVIVQHEGQWLDVLRVKSNPE